MQKNQFLLLKKLKNTESAQLWELHSQPYWQKVAGRHIQILTAGHLKNTKLSLQ